MDSILYDFLSAGVLIVAGIGLTAGICRRFGKMFMKSKKGIKFGSIGNVDSIPSPLGGEGQGEGL